MFIVRVMILGLAEQEVGAELIGIKIESRLEVLYENNDYYQSQNTFLMRFNCAYLSRKTSDFINAR